MTRAAALLLLLAACGDNAARPVTSDSFSGSRLRLIDEAWDGGLTRIRPDALFDVLRDETCVPTEWSDGHRYCSPNTIAPIAYTDAACTQPIALWSTLLMQQPVPRYFRQQFFDAGPPTTSRLYRRGELVDVPGEIYARQANGCSLLPGPTDTKGFAVQEALADEFVRVKPLPLESDAHARIVRYSYISDDDMQLLVPDARYDALLGEACGWTALPGELQSTCAPAATNLDYYTDANCMTPIIDVTHGIPSGLFRFIDPETSCPRFGSLGAPKEVGTLYARRSDGLCLLSVSTPITNAAAVEPIQVSTVERNRVDDGHRLQLIERAEADTVNETRMYDTVLGAECARGALPDGDACIPISTPINSPLDATFTDDACTQRIDLDLVREPLCADPPKFWVSLDVFGKPVIRPLTPYVGTVYRTSTSEQCVLYTPDTALFRIGDALPYSQLARVTDTPR